MSILERTNSGAGAGSAFEHLTEDADNYTLLSEDTLYLGGAADLETYNNTGDPLSGYLTSLSDSGLLFIQPPSDTGAARLLRSLHNEESNLRFALNSDGSLHWGDGDAAPNTSLRWNDSWGGGLVFDDVDGNGVVVGDPDGVGTFIGPTGITLQEIDARKASASGAVLQVKVTGDSEERLIARADGSLHWGDGDNLADTSLGRRSIGSLDVEGTSVRVGEASPLESDWSGDGSGGPLTEITNGAIRFHRDAGVDVTLAVDADGDLTMDGAKLTDALPSFIQVLPFARAALETNWPVGSIGQNVSETLNGYRTSSGAQNAEIGWDLVLGEGTWTIGLLHPKDSDLGIYSILLDGVSQGTIDGYVAGGRTYDNWSEVSGIVVPSTARRRVSLKMATKNGASSGYYGQFSLLSLVKTA